MARRIKSLRNNKKGINTEHREHRSKKNRRPISKDRLRELKAFKKRKEQLKAKDLDNEAKRHL